MHFCEDHLQRHCGLKDPCRSVPIRRKSRLFQCGCIASAVSINWAAQARRSHSRRMVVRRVLPNRPDRRVNQKRLSSATFHCGRRVSRECKFLVSEQEIDDRQHEHCEEGPPRSIRDNNNRKGFWVSDPMPWIKPSAASPQLEAFLSSSVLKRTERQIRLRRRFSYLHLKLIEVTHHDDSIQDRLSKEGDEADCADGLSHGIGSETQKPLAVVVIGGLIRRPSHNVRVAGVYSCSLTRNLHSRDTRRPQWKGS